MDQLQNKINEWNEIMSQQIVVEESEPSRKPKITWKDCNDLFLLYQGDLYIQFDGVLYDLKGNPNYNIRLDNEVELVKEIKITYVKA